MNCFVRDVVGLGGELTRILFSEDEDSGTRTVFSQRTKITVMCGPTREEVAFPKGRRGQEVI